MFNVAEEACECKCEWSGGRVVTGEVRCCLLGEMMMREARSVRVLRMFLRDVRVLIVELSETLPGASASPRLKAWHAKSLLLVQVGLSFIASVCRSVPDGVCQCAAVVCMQIEGQDDNSSVNCFRYLLVLRRVGGCQFVR